MIRAIGLALLLVVAGCGKKKEEAVTPGSAAPVVPAPPPIDAAAPTVDAVEAPADAAVATVEPCTFATREEMEAITGPWTKGPDPLPVTASVLGGCSFELANRYVMIEARPASELAALVGSARAAKERGFPPKTTATSKADMGDSYVTFEGKPYLLRVHADAGETNPDVKLAVKLAALLAKNPK